jgi:hypothetical protein
MSQTNSNNKPGKTQEPESPRSEVKIVSNNEGKAKASVPTMRNPPPPPPKKK